MTKICARCRRTFSSGEAVVPGQPRPNWYGLCDRCRAALDAWRKGPDEELKKEERLK